MYELTIGHHDDPSEGRCAMEWVSYLAGERHTDSPTCVSPFLRQFGMCLNDSLPNVPRQKLRPYLARMIGTKDDGLDDKRKQLVVAWAKTLPTPTIRPDYANTSAFGEMVAALMVEHRRYQLNPPPKVKYNGMNYNGMEVAMYSMTDWQDQAVGVSNEARAKFTAGVPDSVFELLHTMLPLEPVVVPVATDWREVVAV